MFAVIRVVAIVTFGAFIVSGDPLITGMFTILNTILITHLNRHNQEQTDTVVSHLQVVIEKIESKFK